MDTKKAKHLSYSYSLEKKKKKSKLVGHLKKDWEKRRLGEEPGPGGEGVPKVTCFWTFISAG